MFSVKWSVLFLTLFVGSTDGYSDATAKTAGEIPSRLNHVRPDVSWPVWVSLSDASDSRGALRWNLFAPDVTARFKRALERNRDGQCNWILHEPSQEDEIRGPKLRSIARHAKLIVHGEVGQSEIGFFHGMPGTLYEVKGEVVASQAPRGTDDSQRALFLFVAGADISTADGTLCYRGHPSTISSLRKHDRILVFSPHGPVDESSSLLYVDLARHVVVQPEGQDEVSANELTEAMQEESHSQALTIDEILVEIAVLGEAGEIR